MTVTVAGNDTHVYTIGNGARGPAIGGHVLEGRGVGGQSVSRSLTQQHVGDDFGGLLTGQIPVGLEVASVGAGKDSNGAHDVDGLGIGDVVGIGVGGRSPGADHHQAEQHDKGQRQGQDLLQVSHVEEYLLLNLAGCVEKSRTVGLKRFRAVQHLCHRPNSEATSLVQAENTAILLQKVRLVDIW